MVCKYQQRPLVENLNLLRRTSGGPKTEVSWRTLLKKWSTDYDFMTTNETRSFLQPKGLPDLMAQLRNVPDLTYAAVDLRPARTGENVIVIFPKVRR